jgi:hypothetical protein
LSVLCCSWNIQSPECCQHDDWYTTVGGCLRD